MLRYKHLFFDLDRTLWDMEKNAQETLTELYEKYELKKRGIPTADLFVRHYNEYNDLLWDRYRRKVIDKNTLRALRFKQTLAHLGVHDSALASKFDEEYISEAPKKTNLISGAIDLLDQLKENYRLHIITNGFPEVQHFKMKNSGLDSYFEIVVTSEACGFNKPDPRIFDYALQKAGAEKKESIMIGDDLHVDIVGAREFGIDQVYLNPQGRNHSEALTYEIKEIGELTGIVQTSN
jgi:putative hydrolase of the HAD superfamily